MSVSPLTYTLQNSLTHATYHDLYNLSEENVRQAMDSRDDLFAFKYMRKYVVLVTDQLNQIIHDKTNVVVPCYRYKQGYRVDMNNELLKLSSLGLEVNYAYIHWGHFYDTIVNSRARYYELIPTDKTVRRVANLSVFDENVDVMSMAHCQEGQGGTLWIIRPIRFVRKVVTQDKRRLVQTPDAKEEPFMNRKSRESPFNRNSHTKKHRSIDIGELGRPSYRARRSAHRNYELQQITRPGEIDPQLREISRRRNASARPTQ